MVIMADLSAALAAELAETLAMSADGVPAKTVLTRWRRDYQRIIDRRVRRVSITE
jgi:hypothetical protein